jgi:predicted SAM-dependent methyltransferase
MKLVNLGCGGCRPQGEEWWNVDSLHWQLPAGSPERCKLESEPRYIEWDLAKGVPFLDNDLDGILASHLVEHLDAQEGVKLLKECYRTLKPGGVLLISVPDASIFRSVDAEDRNENWERLWGVVDPKNPIPTWRTAALFFEQHKMVFTEDALWCFLREAGFESGTIMRMIKDPNIPNNHWDNPTPLDIMSSELNRLKESLIMSATK